MPQTFAQAFYSGLITSFVFAGVVGALFGDFVLGNRKALLTGGILLCLALFSLAIPIEAFFYLGIGLMVLGSGLYTPNLMARYGKQFYDKPELTDGGFSVLYLFVSLGGMIGAAFISLMGKDNFPLGFAICGIIMVGSMLLAFFNKDNLPQEAKPLSSTNPTHSGLIILGTIVAFGFYWYFNDMSYNGIYVLQSEMEIYSNQMSPFIWQSITSGLILPVSIIIAIIYSFVYFNRTLKIIIGFFITALAFGILLLISKPISDSAIAIMFLSIVLINIGELIMAPALYSVITQKSNPKYLALIISLSYLPFTFLNLVLPAAFTQAYIEDDFILQIITPIIGGIGLVILIVWLASRQPKSNNQYQ